jgi:hypothetical protein
MQAPGANYWEGDEAPKIKIEQPWPSVVSHPIDLNSVFTSPPPAPQQMPFASHYPPAPLATVAPSDTLSSPSPPYEVTFDLDSTAESSSQRYDLSPPHPSGPVTSNPNVGPGYISDTDLATLMAYIECASCLYFF